MLKREERIKLLYQIKIVYKQINLKDRLNFNLIYRSEGKWDEENEKGERINLSKKKKN